MKGQVNARLILSMASSHIFKIMFVNQGKVYEVYARKVGQGRLFGFIEVEELVFGERTTVVVDPGEERIKSEFTGVKCTMLPMHSILRIDEVKKQGISKISALEGSNVSAVETMVAMIAAARQFEQQMKLLKTAEDDERSAARLLSSQ